MSISLHSPVRAWSNTLHTLGDEGFRLFFPLTAIHAAAWPLLWVIAFGFDLPLTTTIPPGLWHVHEMVIGSFGAALIGFITTAVPEWTDTPRLRGRMLFGLAVLWGGGRLIGIVGAEAMNAVAAVCDLAWLAVLVWYLARVSLIKKTTRVVALLLWVAILLGAEALSRYALLTANGDIALAQRLAQLPGFVFLGILGVALARITVPVTNLVLDPTESTSPFRPHPGRLNLAPGLVAVFVAAEVLGFSQAATGYLLIAAGAAFMDRVAESFIGKLAVRAEIVALAGSSILAGLGLMLIGATRLGLPVPVNAGLHVAFMGGLGLGVLVVFSIAGLRHTGQALGFVKQTRLALILLCAAVALRAGPEIMPSSLFPSPPYSLVSLIWAAAFLLWLKVYWPFLRDPSTFQPEGC